MVLPTLEKAWNACLTHLVESLGCTSSSHCQFYSHLLEKGRDALHSSQEVGSNDKTPSTLGELLNVILFLVWRSAQVLQFLSHGLGLQSCERTKTVMRLCNVNDEKTQSNMWYILYNEFMKQVTILEYQGLPTCHLLGWDHAC